MDNYQRKMPDGRAKVAGVIGWPIAHSLSPKLMNHWIYFYHLNGFYIPMPVKPEDLAHVIKALPKMGFRGVNVTVPHKVTVMPLLDIIDDDAKAVGAVNTITIDAEGKLRGSNTDVYGFSKNIRSLLPEKHGKAVILGAGGAAKAVCQALVKEGFNNIMVINRTQETAEAMAAQFPGVSVGAWADRDHLIFDASLLVNATSLGMAGNDPLDIDISELPTKAVVTDLVYTPQRTPLLKKAKAQGNLIVDSVGMLIHQAVPGFKAWFGVNPEIGFELKQYLISENT